MIDVESSKVVRDGEMHHLHYKEDIEKPCKKIIRIADKYGAKITFMLPLSEILLDHKEIIGLICLMIEEFAGTKPVAIWTDGYNVEKGGKIGL